MRRKTTTKKLQQAIKDNLLHITKAENITNQHAKQRQYQQIHLERVWTSFARLCLRIVLVGIMNTMLRRDST